MATKIQLRRGLAETWTSVNPILSEGEMGIETDTQKFKFGDGATEWSSLPYASSGSSGDIPTKLSQLENDCGFITMTDVEGKHYTTMSAVEAKKYTTMSAVEAKGYATLTDVAEAGYTKNTGTVKSVNGETPDINGNVYLNIPSEVTESTVSDWGFTKNEGTVTSVNNVEPVDGNVSIDIPSEVTESTVEDWGFTKNTGTVTSVNNVEPVDGNVSLSYQEPLVSGTNIKTINNESILGEGNIEIQGGDNASWGNITGTLSEQTDLNTELGKKLESTNLVQGSNITLTKNGNNITIAATGEISGSVKWQDLQGTYQSSSELASDVGNALSTAENLAKNLGEASELRFPSKDDIYTYAGSLSSGTIITRAYIAEEDCIINKICFGAANVPESPFSTHVDVIEFDYENSSWKRLARSTVTISAEENTLDTPLFVKKGQALGFSYNSSNSGMKLSYDTKTPVTTYPKYNVLLWDNENLGESGTSASISNPTTGYRLGWWFKNDEYISIPNYKEELDDKVSLERYEEEVTPIYDGLTIDKVEELSTDGSNTMNGTGNDSWVMKYLQAEHSGYVTELDILIASSATFPTPEKTISIGTIQLDETDPSTGEGNWTWIDKELDIVIPSIDSSYKAKVYTYTLPRPLKIKAGNYIVIGGHSEKVTLQYGAHATDIVCGLNKMSANGVQIFEANNGTFSGFKEKYYLPGLTFKVNYEEVLNIEETISEVNDKTIDNKSEIEKIKDDLLFESNSDDVYTKVFTSESGASPCSPNNIFWIDKRDRITRDGYITKIKIVKNSSEEDITAAIAAFTVSGDPGTDTATITRIQQFTLPAGLKEYTFKLSEAMKVYSGETVGLCIPGQLYYGGSGTTNNCINGGSINSQVDDTISGHYNGNLQVQVQFEISDITDIHDTVDNIESEIDALDERTSDLTTRTSYKDLTSVMLVGSSLTEASYCPTYTSWPERLQDRTDITIVNNGLSGTNIFTNLTRISKNSNMRFAPTCTVADIHPTYTLWDDCANGSPTGKTAIELYRKVKDCVESFGSKLLMGSEENYAGQYKAYEATQQAFATEAKIPYSPITRIQQWCYPRNNSEVCPYPVNGASHSGYRANAPYSVHQDLINSLPIYKNVKMFRPRTTYKNGNPSIQDLVYDSIDQRLKYWTALHPGQAASTAPGHIDNLDDASKDVPNTTNINPYSSASEPNSLFLGNPIQFDKYALIEFILEKTGITKGTFEVQTSVEPTKIYAANIDDVTIVGANGGTNYTVGQIIIYPQVNKFYRVLQDFTSNPGFNPEPTSEQAEVIDFDNYIRTKFEEVEFTYNNGMISASLTEDLSKNYQIYDKVRFVVYYEGGIFTLARPSFYGYDGKDKVLPETINYHRRKFGTEMLDVCNPSTWSKQGTAESKALPAPIANYTLYNDTLTHIQLNADGDYITKSVSVENPGYKRVAVRIVSQIWNKIATTRYNGTEWENNEYITNTKDDPLGSAAYINSDFDYGMLKVALMTPGNTTYNWKNILVYPGWSEAYFEADLQPEDTSIGIRIEKSSFVDDSYNNDDKPIFIHHVSIQDITNV